ncbi:EARP and GARP complex-interacting protein 1 isoform X3 [Mirounga angustirostris]|uniref:EARP and GARP complex-interacting protein 1 isoform X3 n=1 Tax=Mirounga angustirostris TaxID=9716 RepID=UPI00313A99CE
MEDDAPVIYGLEFQARALTPQTAETDAIRFLVGTQSLKYDNQIHIIDFDDENNILNKNVLLHQVGEIWHISTSPADRGVLATCYNKPSDSKVLTCAAVWRMPKELEPGSHESPDDSSSTAHSLELLCHLDHTAHGSTACVMWEPTGDGKKVISLADNHILLWDLQESSGRAVPDILHRECPRAAGAGPGLQPQQAVLPSQLWGRLQGEVLGHPKCHRAREDPGGTLPLEGPSRARTACLPPRVWSIRYNHSHDQLVLTGSSDSRVILSNMVSISSEPFGHLVDDDDLSDQEERRPEEKSQEPPQDSVIATYEEHEDSVYAVDWSSADPWLFASLSYDGRLVINRVPRALKYHILL